jgi:hypothetical protein
MMRPARILVALLASGGAFVATATGAQKTAVNQAKVTVSPALHKRMCAEAFESYAQYNGGNSSEHTRLLRALKPKDLKVVSTLPLRADGAVIYLVNIESTYSLFDEKGDGLIMFGGAWLDSKRNASSTLRQLVG